MSVVPKGASTNGATGVDSMTKGVEALRLMTKAELNGHKKFEVIGRETLFYGVPLPEDDRYFWERMYGRVVKDEEGLVAEVNAGSHVKGVPAAERYMELGRWYALPPSTKALLVSETLYGNRVEVIPTSEEL